MYPEFPVLILTVTLILFIGSQIWAIGRSEEQKMAQEVLTRFSAILLIPAKENYHG